MQSHSCVFWVLIWLLFWVNFMQSHSRNLGSCLVCLMGQHHVALLLCVLTVRFMRSHFCVLGSCLACFPGQIHAVILLCPGFLCGLSCGSTSCCPTPVSWLLVWFVLWVNFMRSHSCVLGSCLVGLVGQIHAVPLLSSEFLTSRSPTLVRLMGQLHAVPLLCLGFLPDSCVLGFCLVCSMAGNHEVPLLCPGFLSGLSYGSTSCCPASVSWILAWFVLGMKFMQPHSCVLGSCLGCFLDQSHAAPLLCPGFLPGLSYE